MQASHKSRACTADDLPWMMSLGYEKYGPYDPGRTLVHLIECLRSERTLMLRTDDAFLIATRISPVWGGRDQCHLMLLCAKDGGHWQSIGLLRESIAWAKEHKCESWWFGSETKTDVSALAKRVGGKQVHPRFKIEL